MSEYISVNRGLIQNRDIRLNGPAFFGYDGWTTELGEEAYDPANHSVRTYNDGNIVTLDGSSGPWLARQLLGKYAGILVTFWDNDNVKSDATLVADELGYELVHDTMRLNRERITESDDKLDTIFGYINIEDVNIDGDQTFKHPVQ